MTEQFYIAVKGSLYASDATVFGLVPEEVSALSKRFSDTNKEVINGVLIKANPLKVINSLAELGYRVICSSGETDIIWTLKRDVLDEFNSVQAKAKTVQKDIEFHEKILVFVDKGKFTITNDGRLNNILSQSDFYPESKKVPEASNLNEKEDEPDPKVEKKLYDYENEKNIVEGTDVKQIGTKPEDFAAYSTYKGPRIVVRDPVPIEKPPVEGVILNTPAESLGNPLAFSGSHPQSSSNNSYNMNHRINQHVCPQVPTYPSVHQTLDEMDFEKGIWMPAMFGDYDGVQEHLSKGTPPDIEDKSGYTALHYAARCGFMPICTLLIKAGATIDKPTRAGCATPLHRAALAGHHDVCCLLLRYGANLRYRDIDGRTPLHRAVEGGHAEVVEEFLKQSPEAAYDEDHQGKSPISYAEERASLAALFVAALNKVSK